MSKKTSDITLTVELTETEAWKLGLLLKRLTFGDVLNNAVDQREAYEMIYVTEVVRRALAREGIAPR